MLRHNRDGTDASATPDGLCRLAKRFQLTARFGR